MDALSSPQRTTHRLIEVLSLVSVWSVALVLAACVVMALLRRRMAAAVAAMVLVAGANVTTQVLKYHVLSRPDIGLGTTNTLPSGHTTVAVSLALAGVLVAPAALRSLVALFGSGGATLIGAGTVVGRWHRPGDVMAGVAVCLLWAALAFAVLALFGRDGPAPGRASALPHLTSLVGSALVGLVIVSAGVRPTGQPHSLLLAAVSLAAIGIACAGSIGWVCRSVARHVG
jgi:membrane-associated phospholipid phosphatase